jgi:hypothetical protein
MISPVEFEKKHSTPLEVDSSKKKMKSFSQCNASQTLMYMNSNRRIRIDRAMHMSDEMQTNRREREGFLSSVRIKMLDSGQVKNSSWCRQTAGAFGSNNGNSTD